VRSVESLGDLRGKRVLVRTDVNVPLDTDTTVASGRPGRSRITDDGRIRAALPVLRDLTSAGARVIVCAHLGRPKGEARPDLSLAPVARRLGELLGLDLPIAADVAGPSAAKLVESLTDGDVAMLENVRFEAAETSKDDVERGAFADRLGALADVYIGDAFGAVHRKHASVYDVPLRLPHAAGPLVLREVEVLQVIRDRPARPSVVVLGGSKVSDKLAVIDHLLPRVDRLLVGGGMCFTFLRALGHDVGDSLLEPDQIDACRRFLDTGKVVLPVDIVVASDVSADAATQVVAVDAIPAGQKGLDIGPASVAAFRAALADAATVFWNGPMGVFELPPFRAGTAGVAHAIAALRDALTVVGGGDSAAAIRALGIDQAAFSHISTGGGASLEYLEGKPLPGLEALET
jgi:phosphoglycerate kinase